MVAYRCAECRATVVSFSGRVGACARCGAGPILQVVEYNDEPAPLFQDRDGGKMKPGGNKDV